MTPPRGRRGPERPAGGRHTNLPAGRIGRPHGLDGSFYVTRPQPQLLALGAQLGVGGRTARILRRAGTDARPIVRLEGIDTRGAVQELRGSELLAERADAPALGEDEWWADELEGCKVGEGERLLGTVTRLVALPSCDALEVAPPGGGAAVLVPMVRDAIREVAPASGRIEVDLAFLGLAVEDRPGPPGGGFGDSA